MFIFSSNEPIKVAHLQKLANQSLLNGALVMEIVGRTLACRPEGCNFLKKETVAQVFSCESCEISKNTFFHRTLLVASSVNTTKWKA